MDSGHNTQTYRQTGDKEYTAAVKANRLCNGHLAAIVDELMYYYACTVHLHRAQTSISALGLH